MTDHADLVKRLRDRARYVAAYVAAFPTAAVHREDIPRRLNEAADAIAALTKQAEKARNDALEEAALAAERYVQSDPYHDDVPGAIRALKAWREE